LSKQLIVKGLAEVAVIGGFGAKFASAWWHSIRHTAGLSRQFLLSRTSPEIVLRWVATSLSDNGGRVQANYSLKRTAAGRLL
jgi:hypothetical protein